MLIGRISAFTGKKNYMEIDVSEQAYFAWMNGRMLIQDAFPQLTPDEREFLVTGVTPAEWDSMFGGAVAEYEDILES